MPLRYDGVLRLRYAGRDMPAAEFQLPLRITRFTPDAPESVFAGAEGSMFTAPPFALMLSSYQSRHHSHTLPCMS